MVRIRGFSVEETLFRRVPQAGGAHFGRENCSRDHHVWTGTPLLRCSAKDGGLKSDLSSVSTKLDLLIVRETVDSAPRFTWNEIWEKKDTLCG